MSPPSAVGFRLSAATGTAVNALQSSSSVCRELALAAAEERGEITLHVRLDERTGRRFRIGDRVRVKVETDEETAVPSVIGLYPVANWFEREAFDLYGIVFDGHNDLRRILTDYGFIGHPFRKDFPTTGHVEMRYDEAAKRVVYQPVSIEPREITPRIIREEGYGGISAMGAK